MSEKEAKEPERLQEGASSPYSCSYCPSQTSSVGFEIKTPDGERWMVAACATCWEKVLMGDLKIGRA